jgi:hypothetical protein
MGHLLKIKRGGFRGVGSLVIDSAIKVINQNSDVVGLGMS